ncbi:MAG: putative transporter [Bacteroidales bacterium]|jgi:putative transport protein|nr:putative transporter [Bacteroidales bacterium]
MILGWFGQLFMNQGVAHAVIILSIVITLGVLLGKVKVGGISLGVTWVLFIGIIVSHFGMRIEPVTLGFVKDFGLILFVYSVGLSVGPNFVSSFKKGGLALNGWATLIVLLGCVCAYAIHRITGTSLITMTGVLYGAVTNTPGLGAAQQTVADATGAADPSLAIGYAMAYPLGVLGIIFSMLILKSIFKVKIEKETEKLDSGSSVKDSAPRIITVEISDSAVNGNIVNGKTVAQLHAVNKKHFVITRLCRPNGTVVLAAPSTVLNAGDRMLIVAADSEIDEIATSMGKIVNMDIKEWESLDKTLISKRILITKASINGKTISQLDLRTAYGVNVIRILRSGVDIVATSNIALQVGDTLVAVGSESGIKQMGELMGNSIKRLWQPNVAAIFLGIALGVLLGSLPFKFPGMPQPVKLGLAGGPLIIAILIGHFSNRIHFPTYTTESANLMLREIGICLFLAAVGLGAGEKFIDTLVNHQGYMLIGYGVIITLVPLLLVGILARLVTKTNYLTLIGMIAGSTTDPPALAFSGEIAGNSYPAVGYATVYPLTMFLRVLTAQILIFIAL